MISQKKGAILVVSGPSGCGKSTLLKEVYKDIKDYYFSISTTTREPREGEKNGVDYYFVTKDEFEKDIEDGKFLEYAKVHNNYYGTSLIPVEKALQEEKLVIFDIDVQGHSIIQKKLNHIITSVFITTPSLSILKHRLSSRSTDSKTAIENRIKNAKDEIGSFLEYDYLIINDDLKKASKELVSIANATRIKSTISNSSLVANWIDE